MTPDIRNLVVDGVEYDSVASVPPEIRKLLADALSQAQRADAARLLASRRQASGQMAASPEEAGDHEATKKAVHGVPPATLPELPPEFFLRAEASDPKDHPVYRQVQRWGYAFAGALALVIFLFIFLFR